MFRSLVDTRSDLLCEALDEHTPPAFVDLVELIDLESNFGHGNGRSDALIRRSDHERVAIEHVVDRKDHGPSIGNEADPPDFVLTEERVTFFLGQLLEVRGRRLFGLIGHENPFAIFDGAVHNVVSVGRLGAVIRVFLLDDHEMVRRGLRDLLSGPEDIEVVGDASTAEEALKMVPEVAPDVAILDLRLPDGDGIEVCRELRSQNTQLACLMLTSFSDDQAMLQAAMAGAAGYLLKEVRGNDIVDAVRRIAAGESLLDKSVVRAAMERQSQTRSTSDPLAVLSGQERRLLDHLSEGLTNRQIAAEMFLAEKTVKNYVSNLLMKLGMGRRTEAAVFAARLAERKGDGANPVRG